MRCGLLGVCRQAHRELLICSSAERLTTVKRACLLLAGDFADLHGLVSLRRKHGFLLVIDEAHATFVCGDRYARPSPSTN